MWLPQDGALKIENLQFTQSVLVTDYTHTHTHTHTHHKAVTLGWIVHAGIGIQYLSINLLFCFNCTCVSMEFYMHLF